MLGIIWTHSQIEGINSLSSGSVESVATSAAGSRNLRADNFEINGTYNLTPALALLGSYTFTNGRMTNSHGRTNPQWHTVMLAIDYSLSKRTDVYLAGAYQHAT